MAKTRLLFPFAVLLAVCASGSCLGLGLKYKTSGTYVDAAGGRHAWSVNEAHTLVWDGRPYIPVGCVFRSRCIALGLTDENYQADVKWLDVLKAAGLVDVIVKGPGPASMTDPAAWQKIVDYLDSNGFTYGIELDDNPKEPLKGYLIAPGRYRLEGPHPETSVTCSWPGVDSAIYVVARKADNSIQTIGGAVVKDGRVTINLSDPLKAGEVLIVYPRRSYKAADEGGAGDIWSGFDEYRDRLIGFLKKIKLGPGMRFFLEPFTSKMDFTGEMTGFLPDSPGFRLGLEAYLTKKHVHEGAVNAAWGLIDIVETIEEAARLVPLWGQGRGLTYAYDRAGGKLHSVDSSASRLWRDIQDYRDSSAQECMNSIADAIRKHIADAPVIFKCSNYHRIYANPYGIGGFDGLAAVTEEISPADGGAADAAGPVYSLAEESAKTTWFVALGLSTAMPRQERAGDAAAPGAHAGESAFAAGMDILRELGCKGFFLDCHQARPSTSEANGGEVYGSAVDAELVDRLKAFKGKLDTAALAEFKPRVIEYPITPTTGAYVKRLAPNTWWLPTLRVGTTTYIGDGMSAYALLGEDRVCLWSSIGPKTITLKAGPTGFPTVVFPERSGIVKKRDGQFSLTLTDVPMVLKGLDIKLVFPYETASTEIERLSQAIVQADKIGLDVKNARSTLERAKTVMKKGTPLIAYGMAQQSLLEVLTGLGVDVWIEGEQSPAHNFDGVRPIPGASNNVALALDTSDDPPLAPYSASFTFEANFHSSYEIWVAATPPSEASAMSYTVDDVGWTPIAAGAEVQEYAKGLAWYKIGTANLMPGKHSFKIRADRRRASDSRYYFALDAVVLSPRGFVPNGVVKPF